MAVKKTARSRIVMKGTPAKMVRRPGNSIVAKRMQKHQAAIRALRAKLK